MTTGAVSPRDVPSPNFNRRAAGPVDILLLHYTGMESADAALARLCDPAAKVSAHYLIDEDGTVTRLVAETARAWHAGAAYWAGETDINSRSIGIELVNPGHEFGYRPFPAAQIAALIVLATEILARHPIPPHRVLGHSDVAPNRKIDPGELFPWAGLAARGIGIWPAEPDKATIPPSADRAAALLARIGYDMAGPNASAAIAAFQRRFRPAAINGRIDPETAAMIGAYAAYIPGGSPPPA